jgi:hypothetical protein
VKIVQHTHSFRLMEDYVTRNHVIIASNICRLTDVVQLVATTRSLLRTVDPVSTLLVQQTSGLQTLVDVSLVGPLKLCLLTRGVARRLHSRQVRSYRTVQPTLVFLTHVQTLQQMHA